MSNVIDSVSYDQYKNIPTADEMGVNTKIIFNEDAYVKLLTLIKKTKDLESETGCFFVGRQSEKNPFAIIIDYFTSDFQCEDALISGGSANSTEKVYNELNKKLNNCKLEFTVSGHSSGEPEIIDSLVRATDYFKEILK